MKQINDKLNKIAKAIDETVELPETDLITDSLDAITKALGGTPNDSNLIVDKLDDIAGVAEPKPTGNIEITENTPEGETLNISQYATATVNVSGGGGADFVNPKITLDITDEITPQHLIAITDFILIQNNQLIPFLDGASGETALTGVYEGYGVYNQEAETYYTVLTYEGEGLTIAYTIETENCTYEEDSNYIFFNVTDPTQDANVTVTFTAE